MILPLSVLFRNNLSGITMRLDTHSIEGVQISTAVPGGFGTFTFRVAERDARTLNSPLQFFYACDVIVTDPNGTTLFEGILTDVKFHADETDAYYECDATGWQILLDQPYRSMLVERNIDWQPASVAWIPSLIKHYIIQPSSGQVDAANATKNGVRFDVANGTVVPFNCVGAMVALFPIGVQIDRFQADFDYDTNHTVQLGVQINAIDVNNAWSSVNTIFASGTGPFSNFNANVQVGAGTGGSGLPVRGLFLAMIAGTAGTASADCFASFYNIRLTSKRAVSTVLTSLSSEPIYGHEVVADIIAQSLLKQNYPFGIEQDTSYQIPQFSYQVSDTQRNALDAITAYYNRYWAVWEGKQFYWKSWSPQSTADWVVSRREGAQVDLDPTIVTAARTVRAQWTDALGVRQETDVTDVNQDNSYALAGASKTTILDLGIQGVASAAGQLGAVYFPDHSYEVVGGSITMPANTKCFSQSNGTLLPAYRIRAGDSIRVRDTPAYGSIFNSTSWNRATLFRITATDLDWDAQSMKLTVDNSQASLDQLLSRVQTNLSAKFGS